MTRSLLLFALFLLSPFSASSAPVAHCEFASPSWCDPALPGLHLPIEARRVQISSFTLHPDPAGRWRLDLALSTASHPGRVVIAAWRYDLTANLVWIAPADQAATTSFDNLDVGPVAQSPQHPEAHALTIEWQAPATGLVWHVFGVFHGSDSGSYRLSAGRGSVIPWQFADLFP